MHDSNTNNLTKNLENFFSDLAKSNQEWFNKILDFKTNDPHIKDSKHDKSKYDKSNILDFEGLYKKFCDDSATYLASQNNFYQEQIKLWQEFFEKTGINTEVNVGVDDENIKPAINIKPEIKPILSKVEVDKRFCDPDWDENPFFKYLKQTYFTMSNHLFDLIANTGFDFETKERLQFFMRQYVDAISPTNFILTNPAVIKTAIETGGESLVHGMDNLLHDLKNGYIAMTDEAVFEVGGNLAITKGKVVYRNELIELIQYAPATAKVHRIPVLVVPPFINKYYILDLQPYNSFVKYLVDSGYTVFLISWKPATHDIECYTWEDYAHIGIIQAFEVIAKITKHNKLNTIGYCIGGTILTIATLLLKNLHKKNQIPLVGTDFVNTMVHITTLLDHAHPGAIKHFIDRNVLQVEAAEVEVGGVMSGRLIAQTFSALRANELIWHYWVNNYLLGKIPRPFDILYWNNDVVDLPYPLHAFLLKRLYWQNDLVTGRLKIGSTVMNLAQVDCPLYIFAAKNDHIVPWQSAYQTIHYVKSQVRFVLGASGHTAGVINPVSADKRNYWVNDKLEKNDPEAWLNHATEVSGSWWKDLHAWLSKHSGELVTAKKTLGNAEFKPIMDAPGEYVKIKEKR
jgi:polyhydroxyalkanoate synthase